MRPAPTVRRPFALWAAVSLLFALPPAAGTARAADDSSGKDSASSFLRVGVLGDVSRVSTPSDGRFHVATSIGVETADYLRGTYDNIPEDLGRPSPEFGLTGSVELYRDQDGFLSAFYLSGGVDLNWGNTPSSAKNDGLYEENNFVGVAAAFSPGFIAGVTHTWFGEPDNDYNIDFAREIAFAARYTGQGLLGDLGPQAKVAKVLDGEGTYLELSLAYPFSPLSGSDLSLAVPLEVGVGIDEYYGSEADVGVQGSVGLTATLPLKLLPPSYGNLSLVAGGKAILRSDSIVEAGQPFDDADNSVFIGSIALTFAF